MHRLMAGLFLAATLVLVGGSPRCLAGDPPAAADRPEFAPLGQPGTRGCPGISEPRPEQPERLPAPGPQGNAVVCDQYGRCWQQVPVLSRTELWHQGMSFGGHLAGPTTMRRGTTVGVQAAALGGRLQSVVGACYPHRLRPPGGPASALPLGLGRDDPLLQPARSLGRSTAASATDSRRARPASRSCAACWRRSAGGRSRPSVSLNRRRLCRFGRNRRRVLLLAWLTLLPVSTPLRVRMQRRAIENPRILAKPQPSRTSPRNGGACYGRDAAPSSETDFGTALALRGSGADRRTVGSSWALEGGADVDRCSVAVYSPFSMRTSWRQRSSAMSMPRPVPAGS